MPNVKALNFGSLKPAFSSPRPAQHSNRTFHIKSHTLAFYSAGRTRCSPNKACRQDRTGGTVPRHYPSSSPRPRRTRPSFPSFPTFLFRELRHFIVLQGGGHRGAHFWRGNQAARREGDGPIHSSFMARSQPHDPRTVLAVSKALTLLREPDPPAPRPFF